MARFQTWKFAGEPAKWTNLVLRYFRNPAPDSRRVEHKVVVGLVSEFPTESAAWPK